MRLLLLVAGISLCSAHVLGIPGDLQQDYSGDVFECRDHSAQIPAIFINDDYCDCPDGSDEPGTPACPNGQFYCRNEKFKPEYITSSKVMDMICDCCDGSDEKPGRCDNTCAEKGKQTTQGLVEKAKLHQTGLKLRLGKAMEANEAVNKMRKELEDAKSEREKLIKSKEMAALLTTEFTQENAESEFAKRAGSLSTDLDAKVSSLDSTISRLEADLAKDYGPFNEFFGLREECLSGRASQYEYKVCFFQKAEQLEGGRSTSLGHWKGFRNGYREMAFEEGMRCFRGPARSLTLTLECGETSEISGVEEPEMCVYAAKFRTPLACSAERFEELLKSAHF